MTLNFLELSFDLRIISKSLQYFSFTHAVKLPLYPSSARILLSLGNLYLWLALSFYCHGYWLYVPWLPLAIPKYQQRYALFSSFIFLFQSISLSVSTWWEVLTLRESIMSKLGLFFLPTDFLVLACNIFKRSPKHFRISIFENNNKPFANEQNQRGAFATDICFCWHRICRL